MSLRPPFAQRPVLERFTWIAATLAILGTLVFYAIADEVMDGDTPAPG